MNLRQLQKWRNVHSVYPYQIQLGSFHMQAAHTDKMEGRDYATCTPTAAADA